MLQPLHNYVLLKKEKEEKTTASGIILTSGKEKSKLAVVASIGADVKDAGYACGDKVLYKEYLMFDLFASKSLDSIDRQIINAIESNNNKFSYKAPWYSALIIKLYSVFWNK